MPSNRSIARIELSKRAINTRQPPTESNNTFSTLGQKLNIFSMRLITPTNTARTRDSLYSPKLLSSSAHFIVQSLRHNQADEKACKAFDVNARKLQTLNNSLRAFKLSAEQASVINCKLAPIFRALCLFNSSLALMFNTHKHTPNNTIRALAVFSLNELNPDCLIFHIIFLIKRTEPQQNAP